MHVGPVLAENGVLAASPGLVDLKETPDSPTAPLEEIQTVPQVMEVSETGRPRRQCRQNINYTDKDLDVILEQHLMDSKTSRKRKDVNENEPIQRKRGRSKKSDSGAVTPKTSTSKTKTDEVCSQNNSVINPKQTSLTNGPSTSSANSGNVINEQQKQALMESIKHVEYELKFMDVDRLHFEMQTRDEAHLNPDFRRTLVDDWVATSYDHEFHLGRLMELARNPNQQHSDTIMHTIFVMRGLLNVKNENNLLKLKMEDMLRQQKNGKNV
ncbi:unnamed protein product [Bursaphelenchus okinawaensis]|uniref:Uncharacterized protein n=1 Tax=Bursaphelenchus okinawaensis TaxID=465554 RepID=A0A811KRV2_9BILA|nr:unnamed protein product [Bursaphelenchus okinawaensis]CAG9112064.1 unnamed protein product [Bursaphelenchus okinawaensis]